MKVSSVIKRLQEIQSDYGDIQVYAFGYKIGKPKVYQKGEDELFVEFCRDC